MLVQVKLFLLATFIAVSFAQPDWSSHKKQFGLNFRSVGEEQYRQVVYSKNINAINAHNQRAASDKSVSYTRGVNQFTHLTYEELIAKYTGYKSKNSTMRAFLDASNSESERVKRQARTTSRPCSCTCGTTARQTTARRTTTVASKKTEVDWRGTIRVGPVKSQGSCG